MSTFPTLHLQVSEEVVYDWRREGDAEFVQVMLITAQVRPPSRSPHPLAETGRTNKSTAGQLHRLVEYIEAERAQQTRRRGAVCSTGIRYAIGGYGENKAMNVLHHSCRTLVRAATTVPPGLLVRPPPPPRGNNSKVLAYLWKLKIIAVLINCV